MKVHHLSFKHHPQAPYFFKGLSLELEKGKLHALLGKNGSGKSMLLHLLTHAGPGHGIMEREISGTENAVLVNQRFDQMIADQFTFLENLQFACMGQFAHPFSRLSPIRFFPEFIEPFQIDLSKPAKLLSGGQRQILALLMVLQQQPGLLLLDEPTAALDAQNAKMVFKFLTTLTQQNVTLLVVCHDLQLIEEHVNGLRLCLKVETDGLRRLATLT